MQATLESYIRSIALVKIWTPEQEAERLAARFAGVNRSEFARLHQVPGGASMIYQHMQGIRPISFDAAIAYARGFRVPLAAISPRLAKVALQALQLDERMPLHAGEQPAEYVPAPPPDKFAHLHRLPENCQQAILTLAGAMLSPRRAKTSSPA